MLLLKDNLDEVAGSGRRLEGLEGTMIGSGRWLEEGWIRMLLMEGLDPDGVDAGRVGHRLEGLDPDGVGSGRC